MMESHSHKHHHVHEPNYTSPTTTRLSLLLSRPSTPPEDPLPPPQTAVSVPFKWEEAPGKPRKCHTQSEPKNDDDNRTLELPPRLLFLETINNMEGASPTTVLAGPYVGRAMSFASSYRTPREYRVSNFGSARWSSSTKITEDDPEGNFDFSGPGTPQPRTKTRTNEKTARRHSFLGLSHPSKGSSHFWASIYESFKHMVPWRRRQEKH